MPQIYMEEEIERVRGKTVDEEREGEREGDFEVTEVTRLQDCSKS